MSNLPVVDSANLAGLPRDECLRLLASQEVGRLAVVEGHQPLVFPVNYVLDGEAIVIRTATGTKLYAATRGPVAFEVDEIDREQRTGWSVLVTGLAAEITDLDRPDLVQRLRDTTLEPWPEGEKPNLLRLPANEVSGRRITRR